MKKSYEKPVAEKIQFSYQEQVVASGTVVCGFTPSTNHYSNLGVEPCSTVDYINK